MDENEVDKLISDIQAFLRDDNQMTEEITPLKTSLIQKAIAVAIGVSSIGYVILATYLVNSQNQWLNLVAILSMAVITSVAIMEFLQTFNRNKILKRIETNTKNILVQREQTLITVKEILRLMNK